MRREFTPREIWEREDEERRLMDAQRGIISAPIPYTEDVGKCILPWCYEHVYHTDGQPETVYCDEHDRNLASWGVMAG